MRSFDVTIFDAPLQKAERPTPQPEGAEILIKVSAAGICHSDLHICEGFYDMGGGKKFRLSDRGVKLPLTMGHEIAGEIIAAGPDAGPVEIGRKVVVFPWIGCGHCAICARGQENFCGKPRFLGIFRGGGYATHVLVPDQKYCIDIGDLPPEVAAPYACSGLTTFSALRKFDADILRNESILVLGAGGLGLMTLALLKAMGAKGAIVADIDPVKLAAAKAAGALAVIDARADDAANQVRTASGGAGVSAALDLVGAPSTLQLAIDTTVRGGKIVIVGLIGGEIAIPIPLLPQKALTLQGSYVGNLAELNELMMLARKGELDPIPTRTRPLEEANAAIEELKAGRVIGRTVLTP